MDDEEKFNRLWPLALNLATKVAIILVGYFGGGFLFAWGCMHSNWAAVSGGIVLVVIGANIISRSEVINMMDRRVTLIEKKLDVGPLDFEIEDSDP